MDTKLFDEMFELAKASRENSHSPYSKFKVGSSLKAVGIDKIFSGCNVENVSFGGTICAERNAVTTLVSEIGHQKLEYILVLTDTQEPTFPCGLCLQTLAEFSTEETKVIICNLTGKLTEKNFSEIFPFSFTEF